MTYAIPALLLLVNGAAIARTEPESFHIESEAPRAELKRAEASFAVAVAQMQFAEKVWKRAQMLGQGTLPVSDCEALQANYEAAKAKVVQERACVSRAKSALRRNHTER